MNLEMTFRIDQTKPAAYITKPAHNDRWYSLDEISGTSADPGSYPSGVSKTMVTIKHGSDYLQQDKISWGEAVSSFTVTGSPWILSLDTNAWTNGETYTIIARSYDKAGNIEDEDTAPTDSAVEFICDRTKPETYIVTPVHKTNNYDNYSQLLVIDGTCYDAFGITDVKISVYKELGAKYWHDSENNWGDGEEWFSGNLSGNATYWWYAKVNFNTSCDYLIKARSYDSVTPTPNDEGDPVANGEDEGTASFHRVTIDMIEPDSLIQSPVDGNAYSSLPKTSISGTAEDTQSDITYVKIRISDITASTTYYWNLSDWDTNPDNWHNTNITGAGQSISWNGISLGAIDTKWASGHSYRIETYAKDSANPENVETSFSTATFTFDNTPPLSGISFPVDGNHYKAGALGQTISGTAQDATSDVQTVYLSILEEGTTKWFDGSGFLANSTYWIDVGIIPGATEWNYTNAALSWADGNRYILKTYAVDDLGNTAEPSSGIEIIYDETEPDSSIINPADDSTKQKDLLTLLSGDASDTAPGVVNNVKISVKIIDYPSAGTNYYWDGSTWVATEQWVSANYPQDTQSGVWSYSFPADMWVSGKYYELRTKATDKAGNVEATYGVSNFRVVKPAVELIVSGIPNPITAGSYTDVTIEAKDDEGNRALTYEGTVKLTTKDTLGLKGHPEAEWSESDIDTGGAIPDEYTFTSSDEGIKTLVNVLRFKTASTGAGTLKFVLVYDTATTSINGEQKDIVVNPKNADRLQVVLPGEETAPGTTSGKTSALPTDQVAGAGFNAVVNICDEYWNVVTNATDTISITTTDPNDSDPGNIYVTGSTTTKVTMITAGSRYVEAFSSEGYTDFPQTNPNNRSVNINADVPTRLLLLLPGETYAPGTAKGKTGTPDTQFAGVQFTVDIYATDSYYNINTDTSVWAGFSTTDPYDVEPSSKSLTGGQSQAIFEMYEAKVQTITATCLDSTLTDAKAAVTIKYGSGQNLLVLVPGQTHKPGSSTGKQGVPVNQIAGVEFTVSVYLCDDYWNIKTDSSVVVSVDGNDPYGIDPLAKMITGWGTYKLTFKTAWQGTSPATWTVTATATDWISYTSDKITVEPNVVSHLQVLLPGETADPGSSTGKADSPAVQTAGEAFTITVNAVDAYWNIQPSSNPIVTISANTPYFEKQSDHGLVNGTTTFWVILKDAERDPWNITASTADGSNIGDDTSSNISVDPNTVQKLLLLAPGETWEPGSDDGRGNTPDSQIAGVTFTLTIRTVDAYWNKTNSAANVKLTTTDPNKGEVTGIAFAGEKAQDYTFRTANNSWTITVSTTDGANYSLHTTQSIYVKPNSATQLLILVPGETFDEGSMDGKEGAPLNQTAGISFDISVLACDFAFNRTTATPTVGLTTTDPYDTEPSPKQLADGATTFTITFVKAHSTWTITTSNDGGYSNATSSGVYVNPGTAVKLQILAPDEIADDGNTSNGGKTGTVQDQEAGITFTVTVRGVDAYWNLQENSVANVALTSSYAGDYINPATKALSEGIATFEVTLVKANTTSYLTADDIDAIPLPIPGKNRNTNYSDSRC